MKKRRSGTTKAKAIAMDEILALMRRLADDDPAKFRTFCERILLVDEKCT
jgi:hypothetical protein